MRLLLFILLLLSTTASAQTDLKKGLIAHYGLNGDATDESENANHGVVNGGAITAPDRFGNKCAALKFDGSTGYISIPSTVSLRLPRYSITISAWVKLDKECNDTDRDWFTIVCKSDRKEAGSAQYRFQSSGATLNIGGGFNEFKEKITTIDFEKWHLHTITFDGKAVRYYTDGVETALFPFNGKFEANDLPLEIGRDQPDKTEYFCGTMDDVRIYDRALSREEVAVLLGEKPRRFELERMSMVCPGNQTVQNTLGECTAVINYRTPTARDNCSELSPKLTKGLASGAKFPMGETEITFSANSGFGTTASCTFFVRVVDTEKPVIKCPENKEVKAPPGATGMKISLSQPTVSDNCGTPNVGLSAGPNPEGELPVGENRLTYLATDGAGNTATCTYKVRVEGKEALKVNCPADIVVEAGKKTCGAVVSFVEPTVQGTFSGALVVLKEGLSPGKEFPIGETRQVYEISGGDGQKGECRFKVKVTDKEKPTIVCPEKQIFYTSPGKDEVPCPFELPYYADNCGVPDLRQTAGPAQGANFRVGGTMVSFEVKDASGNTASCSINIEVKALAKLAMKCPEDKVIMTGPGLCTTKFTYEFPALLIPVEGAEVKLLSGPQSGAEFPIGLSTLSFKATTSKQEAECNFKVTVKDGEAPKVKCPADLKVKTQAGAKTVKVEFNLPIATDNCKSPELVQVRGMAAGSEFPAGITFMTWQATDASGNRDSCSFKIEVERVVELNLSCQDDIRVNVKPGSCSTLVSYTEPGVKGQVEGLVMRRDSGFASGSEFPVGSTSILYKATEPTGQKAECRFKIWVSDNEIPKISCPQPVAVTSTPGAEGMKVNFELPVATDNCEGLILTQLSGLKSGDTFPGGKTEQKYQAKDKAGNTAECSFLVNVEQVAVLKLECPQDVVVETDPGKCTATVTYDKPLAVGGNSGVRIAPSAGPASGSDFDEGVTMFTFKASDAHGQEAGCEFRVRVNDKEKPKITCPEGIKVRAEPGKEVAKVEYPSPTVSDNCSDPGLRISEGPESGAEFKLGITNVTWSVMDKSGNLAECSFQVEVGESPALRLSCPNDFRVKNDPGTCEAVVDFAPPKPTAGFSDVNIRRVSGMDSHSRFPVGITSVAYDATHSSGQSAKCIFKVNVLDTEKPATECPGDIVARPAHGKTEKIITYEKPEASDNCGIQSLERTSGPDSGSAFPIGDKDITFTATDAAGNTSTCVFRVSVLEPLPPKTVAELPKVIDGDSIDYQNAIIVKSQEITVYYYDHEEADGDIISLNFDGNWLVNKVKLRNKSKSISNNPNLKLSLEEDKLHFLVLKAWNLGKGGVNTMAIAIYDGVSVPTVVRMNSKIGESGAITIGYKK